MCFDACRGCLEFASQEFCRISNVCAMFLYCSFFCLCCPALKWTLSLASEQVLGQMITHLLLEDSLLLPPPLERPRILPECGVCTGVGLACQLLHALGTRTSLWFGHEFVDDRMLLEHERSYGVSMDALVTVCCWNANVIMVWGTRALLWFGRGCTGNRMH